jgi:hypothetical protein
MFALQETTVFAWLFQRVLTKDEAVAAAKQFLVRNGYWVVPGEADADCAGEHRPVVLEEATQPSKRWYVRFRLLCRSGHWRSHAILLVQVDGRSGEARFDGPEELPSD